MRKSQLRVRLLTVVSAGNLAGMVLLLSSCGGEPGPTVSVPAPTVATVLATPTVRATTPPAPTPTATPRPIADVWIITSGLPSLRGGTQVAETTRSELMLASDGRYGQLESASRPGGIWEMSGGDIVIK